MSLLSLWLVSTLAAASTTDASAPDGWAAADAKIVACFEAMDRDAALAVVNAKFARRKPSLAQLADRAFVTEPEAKALRLRVKKTRPCRQLRLAAVRAHHPLLEPAYTTLYYQADQVFEYLTNAWISYGTANQLSAQALAEFETRSGEYFKADQTKRRSLAEFWLDALQRAHSEPPPSAPQLVTCRWRGLNIACE